MHLEKLYLYQGFKPDSKNLSLNDTDFPLRMDVVDQRSADLYFLRYRVSSYSFSVSSVILLGVVDINLQVI